MEEKREEKYFERNHGKVSIRGFATNHEDFMLTILEIEQYLNNQFAVKMFKKYKVGIRFHL